MTRFPARLSLRRLSPRVHPEKRKIIAAFANLRH
jgi:hypothetical protein